jgi:hypothetical protein
MTPTTLFGRDKVKTILTVGGIGHDSHDDTPWATGDSHDSHGETRPRQPRRDTLWARQPWSHDNTFVARQDSHDNDVLTRRPRRYIVGETSTTVTMVDVPFGRDSQDGHDDIVGETSTTVTMVAATLFGETSTTVTMVVDAVSARRPRRSRSRRAVWCETVTTATTCRLA